jgi:hypothetical protein
MRVSSRGVTVPFGRLKANRSALVETAFHDAAWCARRRPRRLLGDLARPRRPLRAAARALPRFGQRFHARQAQGPAHHRQHAAAGGARAGLRHDGRHLLAGAAVVSPAPRRRCGHRKGRRAPMARRGAEAHPARLRQVQPLQLPGPALRGDRHLRHISAVGRRGRGGRRPRLHPSTTPATSATCRRAKSAHGVPASATTRISAG